MKNRRQTNLDQLRAVLAIWRMTGFDEAYRLILDAEKMLAREREWYEGFKLKPRAEQPPWRVRLALWLLHREKTHPWRRLMFRLRIAR